MMLGARQRSIVASTKRYPPHSPPLKDVEGSLRDAAITVLLVVFSALRATDFERGIEVAEPAKGKMKDDANEHGHGAGYDRARDARRNEK